MIIALQGLLAHKFLRLIDYILRFSKTNAGQFAVNLDRFNLIAALQGILNLGR